jgi:hypothetical protein
MKKRDVKLESKAWPKATSVLAERKNRFGVGIGIHKKRD